MDLATYIDTLNRNTDDVLQLAKSCSPDQLNSGNGSWNILQILEHVCIVDKAAYTIISKPSENISEKSEMHGDEKIKYLLVTQRSRKVEAPERLAPKGGIKSIEEFEKIFLLQRDKLKEDLQSGKLVVDNRLHKHVILGEMPIADWLYFIIHHTQRHIEQIQDIVKK